VSCGIYFGGCDGEADCTFFIYEKGGFAMSGKEVVPGILAVTMVVAGLLLAGSEVLAQVGRCQSDKSCDDQCTLGTLGCRDGGGEKEGFPCKTWLEECADCVCRDTDPSGLYNCECVLPAQP